MNLFQLKSALAIGLIAATLPSRAADAPCPPATSTTPAQTQTVGVFTGEFVAGAPVYRLPAMAVIANRKEELAKMEREEQSARPKQARAKAAGRPPA